MRNPRQRTTRARLGAALAASIALAALGVAAADEGHYTGGSYPYFGGVEPTTRVQCGAGPEGEDVGGVCIRFSTPPATLRVAVNDEVWADAVGLYARGYDASDAPCGAQNSGLSAVTLDPLPSTCVLVEVHADMTATQGWMSW